MDRQQFNAEHLSLIATDKIGTAIVHFMRSREVCDTLGQRQNMGFCLPTKHEVRHEHTHRRAG